MTALNRTSAPKLASSGAAEQPGTLGSEGALAGDLDAAVLALMATGATRWEALVAVAQGADPKACVQGVPVALLRPFRSQEEALETFRYAEPDGANAAFQAFFTWRRLGQSLQLAGHEWLRALPATLERVDGDLVLQDTAIRFLPEGLRVEDTLWLRGSALVSLPQRLEVGWLLDLRDCAAWDGLVSKAVGAGGGLLTDTHPDGITLSDWHSWHPQGERAAPAPWAQGRRP
jgi:hypothetical protein